MARGKHAARAAARRDHATEAQIADLKDQIAALKHEQKIEAARHADELRDLHAEIGQRAKARADELFAAARSELEHELLERAREEVVETHARAVHQYVLYVDPGIEGVTPRLARLFEEIGAAHLVGDLFYRNSQREIRRMMNRQSSVKIKNMIVDKLKEDGAPRAS